jgi:hypothetical protein
MVAASQKSSGHIIWKTKIVSSIIPNGHPQLKQGSVAWHWLIVGECPMTVRDGCGPQKSSGHIIWKTKIVSSIIPNGTPIEAGSVARHWLIVGG